VIDMAIGPDPHVTVVGHPVCGVELEAGQAGVVGVDPVGDPPTPLPDSSPASQSHVLRLDADVEVREAR